MCANVSGEWGETGCKFPAEDLFSFVEELEPAIRAANTVLERGNSEVNKEVQNAFSVKNMATRTTNRPNFPYIGATEVLHAYSASCRVAMQIGTRNGNSPRILK